MHIKKLDGLYRVLTASGKILFSSEKRINCKDWLKFNYPELFEETA
jgi:hypothetical protein